MRADTIAPGDVLRDPQTGALVYTVLRVLDPEHPTTLTHVVYGEPRVAIHVLYEQDGGTDVRVFAPDQDVPLTRPATVAARVSRVEERRAARAVLRRAERTAAEAHDVLRGLRSRDADPEAIARAEDAYRIACQAEDDAALVVDRLDREQPSGLTPGGSCRA